MAGARREGVARTRPGSAIVALLCASLALAAASGPVDSSVHVDACDDLPTLPLTFNAHPYLAFNGEFVTAEAFRVGHSAQRHQITFSIAEDSFIRFLVPPGQAERARLSLIRMVDDAELAASALYLGDAAELVYLFRVPREKRRAAEAAAAVLERIEDGAADLGGGEAGAAAGDTPGTDATAAAAARRSQVRASQNTYAIRLEFEGIHSGSAGAASPPPACRVLRLAAAVTPVDRLVDRYRRAARLHADDLGLPSLPSPAVVRDTLARGQPVAYHVAPASLLGQQARGGNATDSFAPVGSIFRSEGSCCLPPAAQQPQLRLLASYTLSIPRASGSLSLSHTGQFRLRASLAQPFAAGAAYAMLVTSDDDRWLAEAAAMRAADDEEEEEGGGDSAHERVPANVGGVVAVSEEERRRFELLAPLCGERGRSVGPACTVATPQDHAGELGIDSALTPGNYTLWLVEDLRPAADEETGGWRRLQRLVRDGERARQRRRGRGEGTWSAPSAAVSPRLPFSLDVVLEPVVRRETALNCHAPPLPTSLNAPGLLAGAGFLSLHRRYRVDAGSGAHVVRFRLRHASTVRASAREGDVEVDLALTNASEGGALVATSSRLGADEGLLAHLAAGEYLLSLLLYEGATQSTAFCDAVTLSVAVAPIDADAPTGSQRPLPRADSGDGESGAVAGAGLTRGADCAAQRSPLWTGADAALAGNMGTTSGDNATAAAARFTVDGLPCSFPFAHRGRQRFDCVKGRSGREWCPLPGRFAAHATRHTCLPRGSFAMDLPAAVGATQRQDPAAAATASGKGGDDAVAAATPAWEAEVGEEALTGQYTAFVPVASPAGSDPAVVHRRAFTLRRGTRAYARLGADPIHHDLRMWIEEVRPLAHSGKGTSSGGTRTVMHERAVAFSHGSASVKALEGVALEPGRYALVVALEEGVQGDAAPRGKRSSPGLCVHYSLSLLLLAQEPAAASTAASAGRKGRGGETEEDAAGALTAAERAMCTAAGVSPVTGWAPRSLNAPQLLGARDEVRAAHFAHSALRVPPPHLVGVAPGVALTRGGGVMEWIRVRVREPVVLRAHAASSRGVRLAAYRNVPPYGFRLEGRSRPQPRSPLDEAQGVPAAASLTRALRANATYAIVVVHAATAATERLTSAAARTGGRGRVLHATAPSCDTYSLQLAVTPLQAPPSSAATTAIAAAEEAHDLRRACPRNASLPFNMLALAAGRASAAGGGGGDAATLKALQRVRLREEAGVVVAETAAAFTQGGVAERYRLPFTLEAMALFSAELSAPFAQAGLEMRLLTLPTPEEEEKLRGHLNATRDAIAPADMGHPLASSIPEGGGGGSQVVPPVLLPAGTHVLEVVEGMPPPERARRCVELGLRVAIQPESVMAAHAALAEYDASELDAALNGTASGGGGGASPPASPRAYAAEARATAAQRPLGVPSVLASLSKDPLCRAPLLPRSLNGPALLSPMGGNHVAMSARFLADVRAQLTRTQLVLERRSVLRVFVPHSAGDRVDVDIALVNGTGEAALSARSLAESRNKHADDSLVLTLDPGPYTLFAFFEPVGREPLPSLRECPSFAAEVAVLPVTLLHSSPGLMAPCIGMTLPDELQPTRAGVDTVYILDRTRPRPELEEEAFSRVLRFAVPRSALLELDLGYPQAVGAIDVRLLVETAAGAGSSEEDEGEDESEVSEGGDASFLELASTSHLAAWETAGAAAQTRRRSTVAVEPPVPVPARRVTLPASNGHSLPLLAPLDPASVPAWEQQGGRRIVIARHVADSQGPASDLALLQLAAGSAANGSAQAAAGTLVPLARADRAAGRAYLRAALSEGTYALQLRGVRGEWSALPSEVQCAPLSVHYQLRHWSREMASCDRSDRLPTDLFSWSGGSSPYGGPQRPDGAVHVSGDRFPLPTAGDGKREDVIRVRAPTDLLVRVYHRVTEGGHDVDLFVYRDPRRRYQDLVDFTSRAGSAESATLLLAQQADPYLLVVSYARVDYGAEARGEAATARCPYLHLEVVAAPASQVKKELSCPTPLVRAPLPPSVLHAPPPDAEEEEALSAFDTYVLTEDELRSGLGGDGNYRYRMQVAVQGQAPVSVAAYVGFNLLVMDLRLRLLRGADDEVVAVGQPAEVHARSPEAGVTFENVLAVPAVPPGLYTLELAEHSESGAAGLSLQGSQCHRFEFAFQSAPAPSGARGGPLWETDGNGTAAPTLPHGADLGPTLSRADLMPGVSAVHPPGTREARKLRERQLRVEASGGVPPPPSPEPASGTDNSTLPAWARPAPRRPLTEVPLAAPAEGLDGDSLLWITVQFSAPVFPGWDDVQGADVFGGSSDEGGEDEGEEEGDEEEEVGVDQLVASRRGRGASKLAGHGVVVLVHGPDARAHAGRVVDPSAPRRFTADGRECVLPFRVGGRNYTDCVPAVSADGDSDSAADDLSVEGAFGAGVGATASDAGEWCMTRRRSALAPSGKLRGGSRAVPRTLERAPCVAGRVVDGEAWPAREMWHSTHVEVGFDPGAGLRRGLCYQLVVRTDLLRAPAPHLLLHSASAADAGMAHRTASGADARTVPLRRFGQTHVYCISSEPGRLRAADQSPAVPTREGGGGPSALPPPQGACSCNPAAEGASCVPMLDLGAGSGIGSGSGKVTDHPPASVPRPQYKCLCPAPYAGDLCYLCADGYRLAGQRCVPRTRCEEDSCNGHGECDDEEGFPQCRCHDGWGTRGDRMCAVCLDPKQCGSVLGAEDAPLLHGGAATVEDEEDEESRERALEACDAPLLPSSLDLPGLLGPVTDAGRATHLQGWFFLDLASEAHTVRFTLTEPSVLRLSVAPHEVDVDLHLFRVHAGALQHLHAGAAWGGPDGEGDSASFLPGSLYAAMHQSTERVGGGSGTGPEEVMLVTLDPSEAPEKHTIPVPDGSTGGNATTAAAAYELVLQNFDWDREPKDRRPCEALLVELELAPRRQARESAAATGASCSRPHAGDLTRGETAEDALRRSELPDPGVPRLVVPPGGLTVGPAPPGEGDGDGTSDGTTSVHYLADRQQPWHLAAGSHPLSALAQPFFFHALPLTVPAVEARHPVLHVDLGHRFLTGQLGMVLEQGGAGECVRALTKGGSSDDDSAAADVLLETAGGAVAGAAPPHTSKKQQQARTARTRCIVAEAAGPNHVSLSRQLAPGNYTLWLYQPLPQDTTLSPCAPFTFALRAAYLSDRALRAHAAASASLAAGGRGPQGRAEQSGDKGAAQAVAQAVASDGQVSTATVAAAADLCDTAPLPPSFNLPQYLGAEGRMHVARSFFVDLRATKHTVYFELSRRSWFRAYVPAGSVDVDLELADAHSGSVLAMAAEDDEEETMFAELPHGAYRLTLFILASPQLMARPCPSLFLEVAVAPEEDVRLAARTAERVCPPSGQERLPQLEEPVPLPYAFGYDPEGRVASAWWATVPPEKGEGASTQQQQKQGGGGEAAVHERTRWEGEGRLVTEYPFSLPSAARLRVEVGSPFLHMGVTPYVEVEGDVFGGSPAGPNAFVLDHVLPPGAHSVFLLQFRTLNGSALSARAPSCVPFSFAMRLAPWHDAAATGRADLDAGAAGLNDTRRGATPGSNEGAFANAEDAAAAGRRGVALAGSEQTPGVGEAQWLFGESSDGCALWGAESLPLLPPSLVAPGLLGLEGRVHLAGEYRLPPTLARADADPEEVMEVRVAATSLLRVHVGEHEVDVDLSLRRLVRAADGRLAPQLLVRSSRLGAAEVLAHVLRPGERYALRWHYASLAAVLPHCPRMRVELEVVPVPPPTAPRPPLPHSSHWLYPAFTAAPAGAGLAELAGASVPPQAFVAATCPQRGADHWPPAPPHVIGRADDADEVPEWMEGDEVEASRPAAVPAWAYDSALQQERLYLQRRVRECRMKTYTFQLASPALVHAELAFSFAYDDLVVELVRTADSAGVPEGSTSPHVCEHRGGRCVLHLDRVDPGTYVLRLLEPETATAESTRTEDGAAADALPAHCVFFTFRLRIAPPPSIAQSGQQLGGAGLPPWRRVQTLPRTLDTVGLLADGSVHLAGRYRTAQTLVAVTETEAAAPMQEVRTSFTVAPEHGTALLRAYTAPYAFADVDLFLYHVAADGQFAPDAWPDAETGAPAEPPAEPAANSAAKPAAKPAAKKKQKQSAGGAKNATASGLRRKRAPSGRSLLAHASTRQAPVPAPNAGAWPAVSPYVPFGFGAGAYGVPQYAAPPPGMAAQPGATGGPSTPLVHPESVPDAVWRHANAPSLAGPAAEAQYAAAMAQQQQQQQQQYWAAMARAAEAGGASGAGGGGDGDPNTDPRAAAQAAMDLAEQNMAAGLPPPPPPSVRIPYPEEEGPASGGVRPRVPLGVRRVAESRHPAPHQEELLEVLTPGRYELCIVFSPHQGTSEAAGRLARSAQRGSFELELAVTPVAQAASRIRRSAGRAMAVEPSQLVGYEPGPALGGAANGTGTMPDALRRGAQDAAAGAPSVWKDGHLVTPEQCVSDAGVPDTVRVGRRGSAAHIGVVRWHSPPLVTDSKRFPPGSVAQHQLVLPTASLVVAHLQCDFALDHATLLLTQWSRSPGAGSDSSGGGLPLLAIAGRTSHGAREVAEVLSPGRYTLTAFAGLHAGAILQGLAHCAVCALRVHVHAAETVAGMVSARGGAGAGAGQSDSVDLASSHLGALSGVGASELCAARDAIPTDLNDPEGDSVRFGGPVSEAGDLWLHGDFALPRDGTPAEGMALRVAEESLLRLTARANSAGSRISFSVAPLVHVRHVRINGSLAPGARVPVRPQLQHAQTAGSHATALFVLPAGSHQVRVVYERVDLETPCPSLRLHASLAPLAEARQSLQGACTPNAGAPMQMLRRRRLPASLWVPRGGAGVGSSAGNAVVQRVTSYFTPGELSDFAVARELRAPPPSAGRDVASGGHAEAAARGSSLFAFPVRVTLEAPTYLRVALRYRSLQAYFKLRLVRGDVQAGAGAGAGAGAAADNELAHGEPRALAPGTGEEGEEGEEEEGELGDPSAAWDFETVLQGSVPAGNYTLLVEESAVARVLCNSTHSVRALRECWQRLPPFCLPFDWDAEAEPLGEGMPPEVVGVAPAELRAASAERDLKLAVHLSTSPQKSSGGVAERVREAFVLCAGGVRRQAGRFECAAVRRHGAPAGHRREVAAVDATRVAGGAGAASQAWRLRFPAADLTPGTTYTLLLRQGTLRDQSGLEFSLPRMHAYHVAAADEAPRAAEAIDPRTGLPRAAPPRLALDLSPRPWSAAAAAAGNRSSAARGPGPRSRGPTREVHTWGGERGSSAPAPAASVGCGAACTRDGDCGGSLCFVCVRPAAGKQGHGHGAGRCGPPPASSPTAGPGPRGQDRSPPSAPRADESAANETRFEEVGRFPGAGTSLLPRDSKPRMKTYSQARAIFRKPVDCSEHGTPDEATGNCVCREGFAGARCERCAAGFVDPPHCVRKVECGCAFGTCDVLTGECSCPPNRAGLKCEACAAGFAGATCEAERPLEESWQVAGYAGMSAVAFCLLCLGCGALRPRGGLDELAGNPYQPVPTQAVNEWGEVDAEEERRERASRDVLGLRQYRAQRQTEAAIKAAVPEAARPRRRSAGESGGEDGSGSDGEAPRPRGGVRREGADDEHDLSARSEHYRVARGLLPPGQVLQSRYDPDAKPFGGVALPGMAERGKKDA